MKYLLVALLLLPSSSTHADIEARVRSLEDEWNPATKLALAQCLVAETSWGLEVEKAAIAHVLVKRWVRWNGNKVVSLLKTIRAYCVIHHRLPPGLESDRRRWIKSRWWGSNFSNRTCSLGGDCVAGWKHAMAFVDRFATGAVGDPTPRAEHYGNAEDHRKRVLKGKLGRVRLLPRTITHEGILVRLENFFYSYPDPR